MGCGPRNIFMHVLGAWTGDFPAKEYREFLDLRLIFFMEIFFHMVSVSLHYTR